MDAWSNSSMTRRSSDPADLREPFAYVRSNSRGRGLARPSWAFVMAVFLIGTAFVLAVSTISQNGPVVLAVLVLVVFGGGGLFIGWIGIARLRWKYAYSSRYGHFPSMT